MKGVVAAQLHEPWVPADDVVVALGDGGAQVVIDAFARDAAQPVKRADMALQEDSIVMSNVKCAVDAPENGSEQISA
jgi:hypothetical protein